MSEFTDGSLEGLQAPFSRPEHPTQRLQFISPSTAELWAAEEAGLFRLPMWERTRGAAWQDFLPPGHRVDITWPERHNSEVETELLSCLGRVALLD